MRTQELRDQLIENRRLTHQVLAVQEKSGAVYPGNCMMNLASR